MGRTRNNRGNLRLTPGAAQTQYGGGTCYLPSRGINFAIPCADAWVAKVDASGNLVFGTLLGGPANDYGTALAVDDAGSVFVPGSAGGSLPATSHAAIPVSTPPTAFPAQ